MLLFCAQEAPRQHSPVPRRSPAGERWHHDGEAADAAEALALKEKLEAEQRELQRLADEQRRLEDAERQRLERRKRQAEQEQQTRLAELQRIAAKAEQQRLTEQRRQARQAQQAQKEEQQRLVEEERVADERRRALEQRLAAERQRADEQGAKEAREQEEALDRSQSLHARLSGRVRSRDSDSPSSSPASSCEPAARRGRKRGRRESRRGGASREPSSSPTRWLARILECLHCVLTSLPLFDMNFSCRSQNTSFHTSFQALCPVLSLLRFGCRPNLASSTFCSLQNNSSFSICPGAEHRMLSTCVHGCGFKTCVASTIRGSWHTRVRVVQRDLCGQDLQTHNAISDILCPSSIQP